MNLANPPFGGKERPEVQQNFPIRSGETAFLFLQQFIRILRGGGRASVVIKNTFLSNTDNASVNLRRKLLEECDLHTVLDCPVRHHTAHATQNRHYPSRYERKQASLAALKQSLLHRAFAGEL